jgi:hypothetical protein
LRFWLLDEGGAKEGGIRRFRQQLVSENQTWRSLFVCIAAEKLAERGRLEEAITLVAEDLASVPKRGDRWCLAELYRVQGELMLARARQLERRLDRSGTKRTRAAAIEQLESKAEDSVRRAIDVARRQGAKSLELRAAISLSRLLRRNGKSAAARRVLSRIRGRFTEGFATPDLADAKALADVLERG